jgi:hypothetical protein
MRKYQLHAIIIFVCVLKESKSGPRYLHKFIRARKKTLEKSLQKAINYIKTIKAVAALREQKKGIKLD